MSGIDLWQAEGFGFWDIASVAGWDILAAGIALFWTLFIGTLAGQTLWIDKECGWREKAKVIFLTTSLLFPLLRLIWLVCEIWILK